MFRDSLRDVYCCICVRLTIRGSDLGWGSFQKLFGFGFPSRVLWFIIRFQAQGFWARVMVTWCKQVIKVNIQGSFDRLWIRPKI